MPMKCFDVCVVGLGGHGSSTIANASKRGLSSIGFEKFSRLHTNGSSHGKSRVFRMAYFEDPRYVPLLTRSLELWKELAQYESLIDPQKSSSLLNLVGGLMIGNESSKVVQGTLESVRQHHLEHEILTSEDIRSRWKSCFNTTDQIGVLEPNAGYLIPEACMDTYLSQAKENNAELHFEEEMLTWKSVLGFNEDPSIEVIEVTTTKGVYYAKKLILTVGSWAPEVYGHEISLKLHVERRVLFWIEPKENSEEFKHIPIYMWDVGNGDNFYGFPYQDGTDGVKVAMHLLGNSQSQLCTPSTINRNVSEDECQAMLSLLQQYMPCLTGDLKQSATCMYTVTPDEHFLIDFHPHDNKVIIASPCSGHGFKFCSVIGEILIDLAQFGLTHHDIDFFRINSEDRQSPSK